MRGARVAAIVLAAGESRRMGESLKALLPWHGMPLVLYQTRELLAAQVDDIIVVVGHRAIEVEQALAELEPDPRVRLVRNDRYQDGKITSIRAGLEAIEKSPEAIIIIAVGQPRPRAILTRLLTAHDENVRVGRRITLPVREGRRGHPPIFSGDLLPELLDLREETEGLRAVLRGHEDEIGEVEIDDPIVLVDCNTPEEYESAYERFGG